MIDCLSSSIFSESRLDKFAKPLFSLVVLCFVDLKTLPMFLQPSLNLQSHRENSNSNVGLLLAITMAKIKSYAKKVGETNFASKKFHRQ